MEPRIITILTMHRSGSSVFTNWLNQCGIPIGTHLLGRSESNKAGHFEDLDFLWFHEYLLNKNQTDYLLKNKGTINVSTLDIELASTLLKVKHRKNKQFLWKDPRTCLFINSLWGKTGFEIYTITLYRPYEQIINSMYNRHKIEMKSCLSEGQYIKNRLKQIITRPKKKKRELVNDYARLYIFSMEKILEHLKSRKNKNSNLVIEFPKLGSQHTKILDFLSQNWLLELHRVDYNSIYNIRLQSEFSEDVATLIDNSILNKCKTLDSELKKNCRF